MIQFLPLPDMLTLADPAAFVATFAGAGLVEPLRAGLAVAPVAALAILWRSPGRAGWAVAALVAGLAGMLAADRWESVTGLYDDRRIVIDEVAGFMAAMAVLGARGWRVTAATAAAFLFLDRLKPWPFDRIEAVPGGAGVMLDDVAVGLALGGLMMAAGMLLSPAARDGSGPGSARPTQGGPQD